MPTTCKTWSCPSCQPALLALFRARLEIGASRLGRCAFMTVTYRSTKRSTRTSRSELTADASAKDWRALFRRHKRSGTLPRAWFRVTELTKAGVPHHHLLVGPVEGPISCYGSTFVVRKYRKAMDHCACLSHVWARHWYAVTGDSFIVHARPILGPNAVAWYMAKYLPKTFRDRDALTDRGFKRRWSSSRSWPGGGRLRLWTTTHEGWSNISFTDHPCSRDLMARSDQSLLVRDGENLTLALAAKREKLRRLGTLERFAHVKTNRA